MTSPIQSNLWGTVRKVVQLGVRGWEGFALVLCVVLLCVVCFDFFVCFYLFYINISFLLKKKHKKQIQLWLVKKETSPDSFCQSQGCALLGVAVRARIIARLEETTRKMSLGP